ncbi:hypothetical protein [Streptomyces sp. NEAU-W12]|uniref:hypothetical protein n=1 Tax=Streptomyces sp. NEAU-W12 TaxID=2994668 RepID=UPI00224B6C26|nr:hypothetical protein [Streptomyces sp. NEAU-W12]MCX2928144.1 hypothetical protein [Streptomyces sp. NEAU-W12]
MASTLGGKLLYSPGTAAREVLLAAGARVAAATHRPLVVIDDEVLREDTADFLTVLGLNENAAHFLTPAQAVRWLPQLGPQSVLAINREEDHTAHLFVGRAPDDRVAAWQSPVYWLRLAHELNSTSSPLIVPAPPQKAAAHDDGVGSLTRAASRLAEHHRLLGRGMAPLPQSLQPNPAGALGEIQFDEWAQQFAEIARQSQSRLAEAEAALQERQDLPEAPDRRNNDLPGPPAQQPGEQHNQGPTGPAPGL